MKIPVAHETRGLNRILPLYGELLNYCMNEAVQSNELGAIGYDGERDLIQYHYKLRPLDRELFAIAQEVEEIWIVQKAHVGGG